MLNKEGLTEKFGDVVMPKKDEKKTVSQKIEEQFNQSVFGQGHEEPKGIQKAFQRQLEGPKPKETFTDLRRRMPSQKSVVANMRKRARKRNAKLLEKSKPKLSMFDVVGEHSNKIKQACEEYGVDVPDGLVTQTVAGDVIEQMTKAHEEFRKREKKADKYSHRRFVNERISWKFKNFGRRKE